MPATGTSIRDILMRRSYQPFAQVLLQWLVFGPCGHDRRPPGLVIENYTHRLPETAEASRHVKAIVRPEAMRGMDYTPHAAECSGPACNTRGEQVLPYAIQPTECHDVMTVHHYFTKSREDWEFKRQRGRGDSLEPYQERIFADVAGEATIEDIPGAAFVPRRPVRPQVAAVRSCNCAERSGRPWTRSRVCAIFKDEAPYLLEWMAFHKMVGVDLLVLYDNGSTDGGPELVRGSSFARNVT